MDLQQIQQRTKRWAIGEEGTWFYYDNDVNSGRFKGKDIAKHPDTRLEDYYELVNKKHRFGYNNSNLKKYD